jgi:hypothetical protein
VGAGGLVRSAMRTAYSISSRHFAFPAQVRTRVFPCGVGRCSPQLTTSDHVAEGRCSSLLQHALRLAALIHAPPEDSIQYLVQPDNYMDLPPQDQFPPNLAPGCCGVRRQESSKEPAMTFVAFSRPLYDPASFPA